MKNWFSGISPWLLLLAFGLAQERSSEMPATLRDMVETERAFASLSVEKGVRASFLAFFAKDGIVFRPGPVLLHEDYQNRPIPASPPPVVLRWSPVYGDVSAAGDLGYDTGPYRLEDNSPKKGPAQHGLFFSVWKKQPSGDWKVVLDVGVPTPRAVTSLETLFQSAPRSSDRGTAGEKDRPNLAMLEKQFLESANLVGTAKAYQAILSEHARIHRTGKMPVVGKAAISAWLETQTAPLTGKPLFSETSRSGDLGYAYGSYQLGEEEGYYAHVWKLEPDGSWRIVLDVTNPLP